MELEARYYIGLDRGMRMYVKHGPNKPEVFVLGPTEPMPMENGTVLYPVSAEVANAWIAGADQDDE